MRRTDTGVGSRGRVHPQGYLAAVSVVGPPHTRPRLDPTQERPMHTLGEWGPAHLRDLRPGVTIDDFRDEDGERPDDN